MLSFEKEVDFTCRIDSSKLKNYSDNYSTSIIIMHSMIGTSQALMNSWLLDYETLPTSLFVAIVVHE